jgi:glucosamine kinase
VTTTTSNLLVAGLDVGASSTRAIVIRADGSRVGVGRAGGANPLVQGPRRAADAVMEALSQALIGMDADRVRAGVLGLAGLGAEPEVLAVFEGAWRAAGPRSPLQLVPDPEVAFAAGTPLSTGTVLIAGTGAVAAEIRDRGMRRSVDGHGWLLGDDGSAFWLGREAVRAALAALDGRGPQTSLVGSIVWELLGETVQGREHSRLKERLVQAVVSQPPVELARFAPLVSQAAAEGDSVAQSVVRDAARVLVASACAVRKQDERTPIVLAGSVLASPGPVAKAVSDELGRRFGTTPVVAADGAAGAAWLALIGLGGLDDGPESAQLHARVMGVASTSTAAG